ncbi:MAG: DUF3426 domain-containing protein [Sideroxydans sp.]|nr:DUF3426 domain-containing protein [Sideroxydans sp.]
MTDITQCPECGTRFKVTAAQLEAHGGEVRCGRCHIVFDASKHLYVVEPSPQLSLPIDDEPQIEVLTEEVAPHPQTDFKEENTGASAAIDPEISFSEIEHYLPPIAEIAELEEAPATLAQQVKFIDEPAAEPVAPPARKRRWTGIFAALLLLLLLLAQAIYFFRVELVIRLPGLKPSLAQSCALLGCSIELPRQAELMSIESSELESDPAQNNVITLHALLHNRATFTQAYPDLELTLNNLQDQAIARRTFHPANYLKNANEAQAGLGANRELEISLRLDTADLKPAGYRLFLFYPK